jgi:hypothetical protein
MLQAEVETVRSRLDSRRFIERDLAELAIERATYTIRPLRYRRARSAFGAIPLAGRRRTGPGQSRGRAPAE